MFDQGLALVYAFNFGEALRSFKLASELDPKAAMPHWGMALAQGPNSNSWVMSVDRSQSAVYSIRTAVGLSGGSPHPSGRT